MPGVVTDGQWHYALLLQGLCHHDELIPVIRRIQMQAGKERGVDPEPVDAVDAQWYRRHPALMIQG